MKEAFHKMIELRRTVRKFKQDPVDCRDPGQVG